MIVFLTHALPPPSGVCAHQQHGPASTRSRIRTAAEAEKAVTALLKCKFGHERVPTRKADLMVALAFHATELGVRVPL